jgi:hypothetical protein
MLLTTLNGKRGWGMRSWSAILLTILLCPALCFGYGRSGDLADSSFLTTGDEAMALSVSVDTTSAVQVYDSTNSGKWDRETLLQNTSTDYDIFCGTHSGVIAGSGPRFLLPKKPSSFTTNGRYDIYCILETLAGSDTVDVIGVVEYDTKD